MSFGIAGCQRRKGTPKRGVREGKKQLKKREPGRSTLKAQARVQEGYTLVSVVYTRARTMFVCFSRTVCLPRALQCARLSPRGRAPREQSASSERELARMAWRKAVCFSEQLVVRLRPERCPCACVCVYAMRNACSNFLFFLSLSAYFYAVCTMAIRDRTPRTALIPETTCLLVRFKASFERRARSRFRFCRDKRERE